MPRRSCDSMMRPLLSPKGIIIEPEGHMARDKRADISVAMPGRKVLCELKRDYHAEVWTAITGQLERFYAHDPEAKGYGVYCVFWFGDKRAEIYAEPANRSFHSKVGGGDGADVERLDAEQHEEPTSGHCHRCFRGVLKRAAAAD